MSNRTLYYWKPGEKETKLHFTIDDIPVLEQWYHYAFPGIEKPVFKELGIRWMNMFANTRSFKIYLAAYRYICFKNKIKNFF